ncbi:hypothetical protein B9Z55_028603 [Caenorhabditis nigoni]|uniref:Uncharacterized protein n=1 Tax=Caenorhabditis nigoni TaxID=1611254 RepID=A0A2G5SAQ2_9PELO|nr:hypothetical protein B9Z55_028603 [Caenorhabditis nigoni]
MSKKQLIVRLIGILLAIGLTTWLIVESQKFRTFRELVSAIKGVENGEDLDEVTLSTPSSTTAAPGKRTCAECTGGNYHLRSSLMHLSEHGQNMRWVEEWASTDCVIGKIRYTPCVTTCMTVTIQRPENGEMLDSIMMACADDMFWSTPDIPDSRAWYKSKDGMIVFEENARYVAERMSHTIIYEFNTTSSDNAATIANNLKDQFDYVNQEKELGDINNGSFNRELFIVVTMLTIFLMFAPCCYCIYHRCRIWCIKRELEKFRRNPKYVFTENTVEMVDLAVYMEQGLFDVPKPEDNEEDFFDDDEEDFFDDDEEDFFDDDEETSSFLENSTDQSTEIGE